MRGSFDYSRLCDATKEFTKYQNSIRMKFHELDLLKGIPSDQINEAIGSIEFQHGCERFFKCGVMMKLRLFLTSNVAYSDLINSKFSDWDINKEVAPTHFSCEEFYTAQEKLDLFKDIQRQNHLSICVGQSLSDILCLLEADIGLVLGSDETLQKVGLHFGVVFMPLFEWVLGKGREDILDCWGSRSGRLFMVHSWAEVHSLVLGTVGVVDHFVVKLPMVELF